MTPAQLVLASIRGALKYIRLWPRTLKAVHRVPRPGANVTSPTLKINASPSPWPLWSSRSPFCCDNVRACWRSLFIIHVWELTTEGGLLGRPSELGQPVSCSPLQPCYHRPCISAWWERTELTPDCRPGEAGNRGETNLWQPFQVWGGQMGSLSGSIIPFDRCKHFERVEIYFSQKQHVRLFCSQRKFITQMPNGGMALNCLFVHSLVVTLPHRDKSWLRGQS